MQITVLLKHHDIHNPTDIAVQEALALPHLKNSAPAASAAAAITAWMGEQTRRVTGRKQNTRTRTHRLTEDAGVLLQRADALLGTNSVLTVSMRNDPGSDPRGEPSPQTPNRNPTRGSTAHQTQGALTIQETLNMVQVILSGCHLAGNTHRIQVRSELIAAHRERH